MTWAAEIEVGRERAHMLHLPHWVGGSGGGAGVGHTRMEDSCWGGAEVWQREVQRCVWKRNWLCALDDSYSSAA